MEVMNGIRQAQRSQGTAAVLAIGTATPSNFILQSDYADYFFRATKSEHLQQLKQQFKAICKYAPYLHAVCTISVSEHLIN
jgi:bisdemethoxycurcumin synthase